MTVRPERSLLRLLGYAFSTLGAAGLLWYAVDTSRNYLEELRAERQFGEQLAAAHRAAAEKSGPQLEPSRGTEPPKPSGAPSTQPFDPTLIGHIEIPRVGVSAIIREGVDAGVLRRGAGHVPGTAFPGDEGNVALAAHRDRHFRGLRNIRAGDEIQVETTGGTYRYIVESTQVVKPTEVSVLDPTPEPSVTLVTCYPFTFIGPAPERFIVRGRQSDPPLQAESRMATGNSTAHK